jgi:uncharacterized protein
MIVHEFQHSVLGALLDVCKLYDHRFSPRLTVGWRQDPRPLEGALQGTFAHAAMARMWWTRAQREDAQWGTAQDQFQQYFAWTDQAVESLLACGGLTDAGNRFVTLIGESLAGRPA